MTHQTEKIHISEISRILIDRLAYIKLQPEMIITYSESKNVAIAELRTLYPQAKLNHSDLADLIFAILDNRTKNIEALFTQWQKLLKPSGLLLFGGLNLNYVLQDIGDFLQSIGFVNVVMDKEMLSDTDEAIFGHALARMPQKPVSIPLSQLKKV